MKEKGKVAIARLVVRAGTAPVLVALAPQGELVDADGVQVRAAEEVAAAVALSPEFAEDLRGLSNPALDRHYDMLERLALKYSREELGGDIEDSTLPDDETLAQHGPTFEAFSDAVYGADGAGAAGKTAGAKRKAGPEPHTAELYAERDWYSLANSDQLGRLTNDQLKVYLRYHGLTLGGNKADLLARIQAHVNQEPA
ncbi:hypothetical protein MNEG_9369 [Monoraphidium neglectum]|uniref:SAP domain-containing protein n=1 Tax=Monoraphidium neglectum TaxID=145388 RepID=A0A0D2MCN4_9CHLO|nr:hypothetical protein MNEG_9369 [Monoraphidium neglectum]KIY98591.1 hypothetical protein MNEG_9369 [Monoraphidium neglectum]|eukprot:XP_013897611.1 hypothetical protein MNEG_9369 [Monoraphidium neglectum]